MTESTIEASKWLSPSKNSETPGAETSALTELTANLRMSLDDPDPDCRTTPEVSDTVQRLLQQTATRMSLPIPRGSLSTDAANGIQVQWDHGDRHVILAVPADSSRRRYVYSASGAQSEIHELSSIVLARLLTRLSRDA